MSEYLKGVGLGACSPLANGNGKETLGRGKEQFLGKESHRADPTFG